MDPKWLEIAKGEEGVCEKRGCENQRIIEYHDATTLHAKEDEIPWCSSFVNWCMEKAGITPTGSAAARSWLNWGKKLDTPFPGCVCVIRQKQSGHDQATGSASGYHVAFWLGEENGRVKLLGGNQSDQVKVSTFGLGAYDVCGYRWPEGEVA